MATGKTKTPRMKAGKGRTVGEEPTIVQVRFPRELLEAVDQEAERLSNELGGEPVGRSEAIRIIVRRALMAKSK
jgi:metal-responsive CopG/Arc/MetJ family transcriptional regulator